MNEELISVIIPVHNSTNYLRACLDSILSQTYNALEIILTDDASTDDSLEICKSYALKDSRIRILHNTNWGGLSHARNIALDIAKGKYIGFVDSDDTIEQTLFQELHRLITETECDISGCSYNVMGDSVEDKKDTIDPNRAEQETISSSEATRRLLLKQGCSDAIWDKLFKRELFYGIRMKEGMYYEDQEVLIRLFSKAKAITLCNKRLYNYYRRKNSGSITESALSVKKHDLLIARRLMHKTIQYYFPENELYARGRYYEAALKFLYESRLLPDAAKIRCDVQKEINEFTQENGGTFCQRKDIIACLLAMRTSMKLYDKMFAWRLGK